jgi:hypothetical protein
MRRSTVLSLPLQLVFPGLGDSVWPRQTRHLIGAKKKFYRQGLERQIVSKVLKDFHDLLFSCLPSSPPRRLPSEHAGAESTERLSFRRRWRRGKISWCVGPWQEF